MMFAFEVDDAAPRDFAGAALVVVLSREKGARSDLGCDLGKTLPAAIAHVAACGDLLSRPDQLLWLYPALMNWRRETPYQAGRILVAALAGDDADPDLLAERLRLCGGLIAAQLKQIQAREALLLWPRDLNLQPAGALRALVEGLALGSYTFAGYRSVADKDGEARQSCRFRLYGGDGAQDLQAAVHEASVAASAVVRARDMANTPANYWTPAEFAATAARLGRGKRLKATVLDKDELEKQGLNAILAVGSGSARPPTLSVVEYHTRKKDPTLMLVGKGLTFDSGGLCLKPPAGMDEMKYDMCGGAAVMAVMQALPELGLSGLNVVGLVPAAENLSGSAALKPGDVLQHFGGRYSEVVNTDAEGRLVLADVIVYGIATFRPQAVIDVATLTGAAVVGLGHHYSGLLSNNDELASRLVAAGRVTGEPVWRLPLGAEYRRQLDSTVADLKNAADRSGGTITAACYLQEFVGETPWAHLDIAGTAWNFTEKSYVPKGASGVGVRTLLRFLLDWGKNVEAGCPQNPLAKREGRRNL